MKHLLLSICSLALFGGACAQSKAVDFFSVTTSAPADKKMLVKDVIYRDGKFEAVQERVVKSKKVKQQNTRGNDMGDAIDDAYLIDYKSDTLYILSTYYVPDASTSITIKTKKGIFDLVRKVDGGYSLRSIEDSYANIPKDEKESDFVLYKIIFVWDINLLIRLIQSSGGYTGDEYVMSATRIIIKNNHVLQKDIVNFKPTLRWRLE